MKYLLKLFKLISFLAIINIFFFTIFVFYLLWKFTPDLPSYSELKNYNPPLSTRVYTSDGILLDKFFVEERLFVPIEKIPTGLKNAFISAEDKNFYNHYGFDILAIIRATFSNFLSFFSNQRLIGASTITQQVVKNLLLTNEVSFERKIKEIILAIRLEKILSKDKILELYLNDIYLGYGSYGVAAASLNYFNKSLSELNIQEIAFMAALPKAPNNYHPIDNYENAINRRNWVLEQMYSNGYISTNDLLLKNKNLIVSNRDTIDLIYGEYFKEEVRKELNNLYGNKNLYEEGLIVKTTIDTYYQTIAEEVLKEGLIQYDKRLGWRGPIDTNKTLYSFFNNKISNIKNPFPQKWKLAIINNIKNDSIHIAYKNRETDIIKFSKNNEWLKDEIFNKGDIFFTEKKSNEILIRQIPEVNGAIYVLEPHSGKVLAVVGGFSFQLSEFNRAIQAKRQPGSAFKPFVYITALNEGYTPSTLILDAPFVIDQGPGLPKWKPANYAEKFYGLGTMRIGVEKSRNLMTIRLADRIGMEKILKTAKNFNIHNNLDKNLSMALGAGVVTLEELTNAYAMIVNGGKKIEPKLIQSVYNKRGKIIFNNESKKCMNCIQLNAALSFDLPTIKMNTISILNSAIAYQMTSMLEGVILRGTGKKISDLNTPLAGKTGTTNDNKDAWFIGFSPDLVVGVYVGYDLPKSLGFKQTGSSVAVPIFKNFMKEIQANKNKIPFRIPTGISFVKINTQTGLQTDSINGILEAFVVGTEPFNKEITVLDSLGSVRTETLSGTGNLLIN